jgi:hypothetical protein
LFGTNEQSHAANTRAGRQSPGGFLAPEPLHRAADQRLEQLAFGSRTGEQDMQLRHRILPGKLK